MNFYVRSIQSFFISSFISKNHALGPSSSEVKKNFTIRDLVNFIEAIKVTYCLKWIRASPVPLNLVKFRSLKFFTKEHKINKKIENGIKIIKCRNN